MGNPGPRVALALAVLVMPAVASAEDRAARIELTTTSTLYGAGLGVFTSLQLDLTPRPAAWIAAALGGGMLYGSYTLSGRMDLQTPDVRYIETAAGWLALDTMLLEAELDVDTSVVGWSGFAAGAVGAGTALATLGTVNASAGQISLVNTGGLFVPVAGALTGLTLHLNTGRHTFRDLLILNLAGLGAGAALTSRYDPTREQVLYLDGGMLAGGLCGGLVGAMGAVLVDAWEVITGTAVVGMGVGGWLAVRSQGFDRRGKSKRKSGTTTTAEGAERVFFVPLASGQF
jgi:hypothetical protein